MSFVGGPARAYAGRYAGQDQSLSLVAE